MIKEVNLKHLLSIPVYVDKYMQDDKILIGRGTNSNFIIMSDQLYEQLRWDEYYINEERFKTLQKFLKQINEKSY